ncbi:MAG: DUF1501 domain-containing protein [Pirellulales bacterium]|nr:DUF1501 domain-containing protein [Pirellulales bacterium]
MPPSHTSRSRVCPSRREFLRETGCDFGAAALGSLLSGSVLRAGAAAAMSASGAVNQFSTATRLVAPRAKSVIFLYMCGGPSSIDTFDYKPAMIGLEGKTVNVETLGRGGRRNEGRIVEPRWRFRQHGQCGKWISELFPHLARRVDDIAFLHSMTSESAIHGTAMLLMNSGRLQSGDPALGSWIHYGLGTINENLPGFVVIPDPRGRSFGGAKHGSNGYLPAKFGGAVLHVQGTRDRTAKFGKRILRENRREMMETDPAVLTLSTETRAIHALYGIDHKSTRDFGTRCLVARRLVERGVRFIQLNYGGSHSDSNWDAHEDLVENHTQHALATDQPIAALLQDLQQRGLLQETLVVWGSEFGRQPIAEYPVGTGRDHNAFGFTVWLAGGGIKGGVSVGSTDELGSRAVDNPFHVNELHATILHQMGLQPNALSYVVRDLDQKLVGTQSVQPISEIIG